MGANFWVLIEVSATFERGPAATEVTFGKLNSENQDYKARDPSLHMNFEDRDLANCGTMYLNNLED